MTDPLGGGVTYRSRFLDQNQTSVTRKIICMILHQRKMLLVFEIAPENRTGWKSGAGIVHVKSTMGCLNEDDLWYIDCFHDMILYWFVSSL